MFLRNNIMNLATYLIQLVEHYMKYTLNASKNIKYYKWVIVFYIISLYLLSLKFYFQ